MTTNPQQIESVEFARNDCGDDNVDEVSNDYVTAVHVLYQLPKRINNKSSPKYM